MIEQKWYSMMGISKIFLRNFVLGCFTLCISTIVTLASLLKKSYEERAMQDLLHKKELTAMQDANAIITEAKNKEIVSLLREVFKHQSEIDKEIIKIKTNSQK